MSEAALELKENDVSIVDLAMKYGYQSREAFSRAFVSLYGKNPSQVKDDGFVYTIRKPFTVVDDFIDYPYTIQSLNMQFEEIKSYHLEDSVNPKSVIPHFLNDFILNYHDDEFYGILDFKTNKYRICKSKGTGQKIDCLIFKLEDDVIENIQKTITYVYRNLMKDSKYEHADACDLEYYTYKNNKLIAILYIPIKSMKNDI